MQELIRDQFNEPTENSRHNLLGDGKNFRMNNDEVEQNLLDVAAHFLGGLTGVPVKVTDLNALLYDANDRLTLTLDVLVKDLVVKFL